MKKLFMVTILVLVSVSAFALSDMCPSTLSCKISNSQAICENFPNSWKIQSVSSPDTPDVATYFQYGALWDASSAKFNNVQCFYSTGSSSFFVDRALDAPLMHPDFTDFYGWYYTNKEKTTASCSSRGACLVNND